ncbi:MAG TPA: sugar phosphate isomerase/epimerase family protein [Candidatus Acidoferrum sp.]|nr:sugar phosphate isomerase/epimerase family protein [Candidatus Acidoferrum sp.]
MHDESRRRFLKTSAWAATLAGTIGKSLFAAAPQHTAITKGILLDMLPANLSYGDRLKLARDIGFAVIQAPTEPDDRKAEELKKGADAAGIRIDSVMNMDHWKYPLSSNDPAVVEKSLAGMRTSMHNAKVWGADVVLLVPAVLDPKTSYREAWTRSQAQIRKLLPLAEEWKVVIAMEEVWNRFLLSPLEMATYIDEFKSPYVKAWFDVGNVVLYGYPQDWIRTLDQRIVKVHLKDFKRNKDSYAWVNLGEGDIDWTAVRDAFAAIGYAGSATVELPAGDEVYLRDVSRRVDRLLLNHS